MITIQELTTLSLKAGGAVLGLLFLIWLRKVLLGTRY